MVCGVPDRPRSDETSDWVGPVPGMTRRRVVGTLFLIVFLDLLGFGILIPVIPLYAKFFGANEFIGSLLIATYSLFQFAGAPVLGRLSDERGRRPILLLSLSGSVIAWTLFGLAGELGGLVGAVNGLVVLFLPERSPARWAATLPRRTRTWATSRRGPSGPEASASWEPRSGSASSSGLLSPE